MTIMRVKKNDYGIDLVYTVRDENGNVLDISDADTVYLLVGRYGETAPLVNEEMDFVNTGSDGQVKYTIVADSLDTAGYFDAEIQINYTNGRRTTRPFTLQILEEL